MQIIQLLKKDYIIFSKSIEALIQPVIYYVICILIFKFSSDAINHNYYSISIASYYFTNILLFNSLYRHDFSSGFLESIILNQSEWHYVISKIIAVIIISVTLSILTSVINIIILDLEPYYLSILFIMNMSLGLIASFVSLINQYESSGLGAIICAPLAIPVIIIANLSATTIDIYPLNNAILAFIIAIIVPAKRLLIL